MECPRCHVSLTPRRHGDVEVPECPDCRGLFLHRGELNKMAHLESGDLEYSTLHDDSREHADGWPPIACPDCGAGPMHKVEFNIYTNIILDWCEPCGGFWIDGPELVRIEDEVRTLNEKSEDEHEPPMMWFARFIWTLPR